MRSNSNNGLQFNHWCIEGNTTHTWISHTWISGWHEITICKVFRRQGVPFYDIEFCFGNLDMWATLPRSTSKRVSNNIIDLFLALALEEMLTISRWSFVNSYNMGMKLSI